MPHDTPYRVEVARRAGPITEYAIYRSGDGELVSSTDVVLLHRIIDLLNEDERGADINR